MQRDHAKTLEGLHAEIQKLQEKCADLTFRLAMEETSRVPDPVSSSSSEATTKQRIEELESILRTREEDVVRLEAAVRDREGRLNAVVIQIDREREARLREAASFTERERALKSELEARAGRVAFLTAQLHKIKVSGGGGGGGGSGEAAFITLQPHPNPQGTSSSSSTSNHRHMQPEAALGSMAVKERRRGGVDALAAGWGSAGDEEANGSGAATSAAAAPRHLRPVRPPSSSSSSAVAAAAAAANRRAAEESLATGNAAQNSKRVVGARTRRFRQVAQEDGAFGDDEASALAPSAAATSGVIKPKPPVLPPIHGPSARGVEDRGRGGANNTGLNYNNNNNSNNSVFNSVVHNGGRAGLDSECQSGDEDPSFHQQNHHLSPQHRHPQQQQQYEDVSIIDLQASANGNAAVYAKENLPFNVNGVQEISGATPGDLHEAASGGAGNGAAGGTGIGVARNLEGPVLVRKARVRTVSRRELARHQHHHQAPGKGGGGGDGVGGVGGGGGGAAEVGVLALDAAEKVPSSMTGWRQGKVQNNPTTP